METYFPTNNAEAGFVGFPSAEGEPVYPLGVGSTFSIASAAQNPDGAAAAIDYIFTDAIYTAMGNDWQGEWNTPLADLSNVKLNDTVPALYTESMKTLATSVSEDEYGYTTWTFMPPATNSYLVSGIEEVWLDRITVEQFLEQLNTSFQQELGEGKVPAIPAR